MLPTIVTHAKIAFRHLRPEARSEAIQEVVANCCRAYARLVELGKVSLAYPHVLARFGVKQTRDHRKVGGRLNIGDVLGKYCQTRKHVVVERLDHFDETENQWQEAVVEDTRTALVPDIVAFRVDFADWLKSLKRRDRRIAEFLSLGNQTSVTARKFGVSAGHVSQLRRELADSWKKFTGENGGTTAA
ncbi:MAG: hypothetical protein ACLP9L_28890 [Thermoguttaceae bacterium]